MPTKKKTNSKDSSPKKKKSVDSVVEEKTKKVDAPSKVEKEKTEKKEKKKENLVNSFFDMTFVEEEIPPFEDDFDKPKKKKLNKHIWVHIFLILVLLSSLGVFGLTLGNPNNSIVELIQSLVLTVFTILFVGIAITIQKKSKFGIFVCGLLLLSYFALGLNGNTTIGPSLEDFSGKSLTYVMEWASKNHIQVNQEYEYSDMVEEYSVISQDIDPGTSLAQLKEITVSISEGPNPSKEIMVPSMIGWDSEQVIAFVKDHYLSNVIVEFISSDKPTDTVIEQSASGNFKRDDELKLTFSFGEELGFSEVKLIDFKKKTKFEVELYMKKNQLSYEFAEEFSDSIPRGSAIKQSIKAGEMVSINGDKIVVTISKGPEIKVPNLTKMNLSDITQWAIENKLKISFSNQYDANVKENGIISSSFEEGSIIEQGTVVKIVLSNGSLKMKEFDSLNDFYTWANRYEIPYTEEHEFSDSVPQGEVIRYSYKKGQVIQNGDSIVVVISDGTKKTVPNVVGLTRSNAIGQLEKAGLKYSVNYRNSSETKDKVLSQSIRSGSEVSSGTTVVIAVSNGKTVSNNSGGNSGNNSGGNSNPTPTPTPTPVNCSCNIPNWEVSLIIGNNNSCSSVGNALKNLVKQRCPNVSLNVNCVDDPNYSNGSYVGGYQGGETNSCSLSIFLAN